MSPALPPKRKSMVVSNPTLNGAETGGESKVIPPPASEDNLPALPPKKSVSRMSAEVNGPPVPEKPKVRENVNFGQRHDGISQMRIPVSFNYYYYLFFFCEQVIADHTAANAITTVVCLSCLIVLCPKSVALFTCNFFFLLRGRTKKKKTQLLYPAFEPRPVDLEFSAETFKSPCLLRL